jgi:class 3 adenylate cyclase
VRSALRQWLDTLGLAQYGDRFAADDMDTDVLPSLSEQDLAQLGVSMGHRKRLLKAIAELTGAPASAAASGTASAAPPPPAGAGTARKVVTIVFADLIGSTSLHEQLDAESVTRLMERYFRAMRGAVEAHGGTVVKLMGDGVMAAFGVPRVADVADHHQDVARGQRDVGRGHDARRLAGAGEGDDLQPRSPRKSPFINLSVAGMHPL